MVFIHGLITIGMIDEAGVLVRTEIHNLHTSIDNEISILYIILHAK